MGNKRFIGQDSEPQANYFKAWRVYRNLRQGDVEKILRLRPGRISNLECGRSVYTRHVLQALARVYGCTTAQLLGEPPPGKSFYQGSFEKQAEITAANLIDVLKFANRLQTAAAVLRDRVVPQIDALMLDFAQAGEAANSAISDAERLADTFAEYLAQVRPSASNVSGASEREDASVES